MSTLVFNIGSLVACVLAIAAGGAPWSVYVILLASIVFVAGTLLLLRDPPLGPGEVDQPAGPRRPRNLARRAVCDRRPLASLVFGLGPLIAAGEFGRQLGYSGQDEFIYRQAGAATLGAAVGGMLALYVEALARGPPGGGRRPDVQCGGGAGGNPRDRRWQSPSRWCGSSLPPRRWSPSAWRSR